MRRDRIRLLAFSGLFAALVLVATWQVRIPVGAHGGYIHFGDAIVYLAAAMLPAPWAMAASAVGAGLSDIMSPGGAVWLLPTIIIKPLCCLAFTNAGGAILCRRNLLGVFIAGAVTVAGYFLAAAVIGGPAAAIAELPLSWIQPAGSGALFLAAAKVLDKTGLRNTMHTDLRGNHN